MKPAAGRELKRPGGRGPNCYTLEARAMPVPPNFRGVKLQYGAFCAAEGSDLKGRTLKGFRVEPAWKLCLRLCKGTPVWASPQVA